MKISTRARYALRMMIDLADNADASAPIVLRDIAKRQQISKRYLEQLAISLKNANLLTVATGRGGGYRLRRPAEEIRVGEIVEAAIGPINVVDCVDENNSCARISKCPSRRLWVELNNQINATLDRFTLAELSEREL